jgi:hypothetical protein
MKTTAIIGIMTAALGLSGIAADKTSTPASSAGATTVSAPGKVTAALLW